MATIMATHLVQGHNIQIMSSSCLAEMYFVSRAPPEAISGARLVLFFLGPQEAVERQLEVLGDDLRSEMGSMLAYV